MQDEQSDSSGTLPFWHSSDIPPPLEMSIHTAYLGLFHTPPLVGANASGTEALGFPGASFFLLSFVRCGEEKEFRKGGGERVR